MIEDYSKSFLPKAEIDVKKLKLNAQKIKGEIASSKLIAVVKSDAYGHGLQSATYIEEFCDGFAVSRLSEVISLRFLGITKPIMMLVPLCESEMAVAIRYGASVVCESACCAQAILKLAQRFKVKVNLKVDTGMNRLGARGYIDFFNVIKLLDKNKNVIIESLFSHFYCAESYENCEKQFEMFSGFKNIFKDYANGFCHISASGGLNWKIFNEDAVRVGILLYGYKPFVGFYFDVEKVMRVVALPIKNNSFEKNQNCLYNQFSNDGKYALVNYGYADGLPRNNQINECMDLSLIKLSKKNILPSGEVVIMDDAEKLAKKHKTIAYEILTKCALRLEKEYKE